MYRKMMNSKQLKSLKTSMKLKKNGKKLSILNKNLIVVQLSEKMGKKIELL
jgi:hypothetical protein